MATREERQREQAPARTEATRERENQWRAYCPIHNCSVATPSEGEAQHCRRIHNDGCDEDAARVERIRDGATERVCAEPECGHSAEQRFGFVDGRLWRCFIHGEPADERAELEGGDDDA